MTNLDIKKYFDIYDYETIITVLKNKYTFVSFCKKSTPGAGSLTLPTEKINVKSDAHIIKVIDHKKTGFITLKTVYGFLKFTN